MRELSDHPGYYVTKEGAVHRRLRSKFRKNEYKKLRPFYGKKGGGGVVTLYNKETGRRTYRKVAQLVLEAFGSPRPSASSWALHVNGRVRDDRLENLAWREKGEIRIVLEESTGNFRAKVGGTDIGSWPSEKAARRSARRFKKTGTF